MTKYEIFSVKMTKYNWKYFITMSMIFYFFASLISNYIINVSIFFTFKTIVLKLNHTKRAIEVHLTVFLRLCRLDNFVLEPNLNDNIYLSSLKTKKITFETFNPYFENLWSIYSLTHYSNIEFLSWKVCNNFMNFLFFHSNCIIHGF